jgi:hypothetical protein
MTSARLMAVGDVAHYLGRIDIFEKSLSVLKYGDLRFAQVEEVLSSRGALLEGIGIHKSRVDPTFIQDYKLANFDVVSLASNHTMDWGPQAALDSIETFRNAGISTIGSGANIKEARKPAVIEKKGVKIAFLGYCSVLTPAEWATESRAGIAPVRAHTYYEPYDDQPATPAHIVSIPDERDVELMIEDIKAARGIADVVVVSHHWGVHHVAGYIADYQIKVAHAAIDAGSDLILGHHAHQLKGVEIYKGKPCIYSLGNFAIALSMARQSGSKLSSTGDRFTVQEAYDYDLGPNLQFWHKRYWPLSVIAQADLSKDGRVDLQFIPVYLDELGIPTPLSRDEPKYNEVVQFLKWSSERFGTKWDVAENLAIVN